MLNNFLTIACKCAGGGRGSGGPIWLITPISLIFLADQPMTIAKHMCPAVPPNMDPICSCYAFVSPCPSYAPIHHSSL